MFESYASQYGVSCVVVEAGDKSSDVIAYAKDIDAITHEGREEVLVVQLPGSSAPECYSEDALRRSFRKRYERDSVVTGVKVIFFTEENIPDGKVTSIAGSVPRRGSSLTVAPIQIGDRVVEVFSVRT